MLTVRNIVKLSSFSASTFLVDDRKGIQSVKILKTISRSLGLGTTLTYTF